MREVIWVNSKKNQREKETLSKKVKKEEHMKYFELYFLLSYANTMLLMSLIVFIKYNFISKIKNFHVLTMAKNQQRAKCIPKSSKLFPSGSEIQSNFHFPFIRYTLCFVVSKMFDIFIRLEISSLNVTYKIIKIE